MFNTGGSSVQYRHSLLGKFKQNHSIILSGPSSCGKTTWVLNLLNRPEFFDIPPKRVVWCSKTQPPTRLATLRYPVKVFATLPDLREIRQHDFWVIDDLATELSSSKSLTEFFTLWVHHGQCMLAYLTQDFFMKGSESSTRSKNCHYIVIFKDPRNAKGVDYLGLQMFPRKSKILSAMFEDATDEKEHTYLLLDFLQKTPKSDRICANIFSTDPVGDPVVWYVPTPWK